MTTSVPRLNVAARPPLHRVRARVDGWPIHIADLNEAVETVFAATRESRGFLVFTLNLDHLVKLRHNLAFRRAYRRADIVTADGQPVVWLTRLDTPEIVRTTGADLFRPLAMEAARQEQPVYLFGATDEVLSTVASRLTAESAGRLKIAGFHAPSGNFDPEGPEADAAIEQIRASGARLCFVALGAPKQEVFAARAVEKGVTAGFVCIGAAVDFVAGTQVRAPEFFQRNGLEWAWRLAGNPRRLARRYADCARVLADIAVFDGLKRRIAGREL